VREKENLPVIKITGILGDRPFFPVTQQSLDIHHGSVTVASSGGCGAQLHTSTTKTYNTETLECLVCTGAREHHNILDNFEGKGITIMLGDQHCPAIITIESSSCVISMRYSNTTLTEQHKCVMLPALKNSADFHSKDRNGFTDILQHALHEGIEIKLIISSGTSWLTDGPAGYAEGQQVMYDWSQAHMFRMGKQGVGARSLIPCILFPKPMVPYINLGKEVGKDRLMLTQHSFEAKNDDRC
jgi:hypothetical protein